MKIEVSKSITKVVKFEEILPGECFEYDNRHFVRLSKCSKCVLKSDTTWELNTFCFENYNLLHFTDQLVTRCNATVNIRPIYSEVN